MAAPQLDLSGTLQAGGFLNLPEQFDLGTLVTALGNSALQNINDPEQLQRIINDFIAPYASTNSSADLIALKNVAGVEIANYAARVRSPVRWSEQRGRFIDVSEGVPLTLRRGRSPERTPSSVFGRARKRTPSVERERPAPAPAPAPRAAPGMRVTLWCTLTA